MQPAVNHDAEALAIHAANHPDTIRLQCNVRDGPQERLARVPPIDISWFSPDCAYLNRAKAGRPIRTDAQRCTRDLACRAAPDHS